MTRARGSWNARVPASLPISESFRGKSRVQQHQIVYQSLRGQMGGLLHALALQTGVPGGPGVPEG